MTPPGNELVSMRIIALAGEITDDAANEVTAKLLFLESEDRSRPITLRVNSPGGSVTASLAIIDTMGFVAPRLSTECAGQAGGMALLIAAAGARGLRFATPTARLAFAQFVPARQTASALERREMERLEHVTCELFARFTGQDLTSIERFCHEAHSVRAEAAIQLGLIDQLRG